MGTKIGKGMKDGNGNLGGCRTKKRDARESARAYYFLEKFLLLYILLLYINVLGGYRQRR